MGAGQDDLERARRKESLLLHSMTCTELGLGFCSIASLNPSLSVGMALVFVPVFLLFLGGRGAGVTGALRWVLFGVVMQPSVLLCMIMMLMQHGGFSGVLGGAGSAIEEARFNWAVFGAWIWPLFLWVYSVVIQAQVIVVVS